MPARIVIVHDDASVLHPLAQALEAAGLGVAAFDNVFAAWHALGRAATVEVLITRTRFGPSSPQGLALTVRARKRRPGLKVLFIGPPRSRTAFSRIGEFVPYQTGDTGEAPIDVSAAVAAVARLLDLTFISPQPASRQAFSPRPAPSTEKAPAPPSPPVQHHLP
jgi:DNA-binding NtrC family response regulator